MQIACQIEPTAKDEWETFYTIQAGLGWEPFDKAHEVLEAIDPKGCMFGKVNHEVISSITALKYSSKYGYIGTYWVKPEERGKGYGMKIFEKGMEYLKDCEIISLQSVQEHIATYLKSGFKAHSNIVKAYACEPPTTKIPIKSLITTEKGGINISEVAALDNLYFPGDRTKMIQKYFEIGFPIVSYDPETKKVLGYGVVNKYENGVALAPLVAETPEIAEEIIQTMFYNHKAKRYLFFYSDEYENTASVGKKWFPVVQYVCLRMQIRTENFKSDFDRSHVYGVNSYEMG